MSRVEHTPVLDARRAALRAREPLLRRLWCDGRGASSVEYVALLALVCTLAVSAWNVFGSELGCKLGRAASDIFTALHLSTREAGLDECVASSEGGGDALAAADEADSLTASAGAGASAGGGAGTPGTDGRRAGAPGGRAPPGKAASSSAKSAAAWSADVLKVMCPQDKAFLADLNARGVSVTLYDRIYFDDPYYDGKRWTTKRFEAGGTTDGNQITILRSGDANADAATLYHEGVHTAQAATMAWRDREYQAYIKEEQWRIAHGIPADRPSFRTTDATGKQVSNDAAIQAFVDKQYPGVTAAPATGTAPEQVIGKTRSGETRVLRADGSTYTRAPRAGDSFSATNAVTVPKGGVKVDMAKLKCP